jgi:hypothetical protein
MPWALLIEGCHCRTAVLKYESLRSNPEISENVTVLLLVGKNEEKK